MRDKITLGEGSVEQRLKKAEKFLQHFQRKVNKASILLVPPSPIAAYIENPLEDGTLFSILLPVKGTIINPSIFIAERPAPVEPVVISISVDSTLASFNANITIKHNSGQHKDKMKVGDMTMLTASLAKDTNASKFWFSALYTVSTQYMDQLNLIED